MIPSYKSDSERVDRRRNAGTHHALSNPHRSIHPLLTNAPGQLWSNSVQQIVHPRLRQLLEPDRNAELEDCIDHAACDLGDIKEIQRLMFPAKCLLMRLEHGIARSGKGFLVMFMVA